MRVEAGAVVDEFDLPGIGQVVARYTRMKAPDAVSWACLFTVVAGGNTDLAIVHRLSAPTLAEARRSVRQAVEFLAGRAATNAPVTRPDTGPVTGPVSGQVPGSVNGPINGSVTGPVDRRHGDRGRTGRPALTGIGAPKRTADPRRGVVPAFRLPDAPAPTDHLPAPLL